MTRGGGSGNWKNQWRKASPARLLVPGPSGTVPGFFENEQADGRFPMSLVVILGAGISGHTTATFARKWLGRDHTVTVLSPNGTYNWVRPTSGSASA